MANGVCIRESLGRVSWFQTTAVAPSRQRMRLVNSETAYEQGLVVVVLKILITALRGCAQLERMPVSTRREWEGYQHTFFGLVLVPFRSRPPRYGLWRQHRDQGNCCCDTPEPVKVLRELPSVVYENMDEALTMLLQGQCHPHNHPKERRSMRPAGLRKCQQPTVWSKVKRCAYTIRTHHSRMDRILATCLAFIKMSNMNVGLRGVHIPRFPPRSNGDAWNSAIRLPNIDRSYATSNNHSDKITHGSCFLIIVSRGAPCIPARALALTTRGSARTAAAELSPSSL